MFVNYAEFAGAVKSELINSLILFLYCDFYYFYLPSFVGILLA